MNGHDAVIQQNLHDINIYFLSNRMGIIGEPLSNFNPITLTPKGVGVEEGEEEETGSEERRG